MSSERGKGLLYIGGTINSKPSDQTDLKQQRKLNLGGGGESTYKGETNRRDPQAGWPMGWAGRPTTGTIWPTLW
jgi:hypothetical protein